MSLHQGPYHGDPWNDGELARPLEEMAKELQWDKRWLGGFHQQHLEEKWFKEATKNFIHLVNFHPQMVRSQSCTSNLDTHLVSWQLFKFFVPFSLCQNQLSTTINGRLIIVAMEK